MGQVAKISEKSGSFETALTGDKEKDKRKGITDKSNAVQPTPRAGTRSASSRLGTGLDPATSAGRSPAPRPCLRVAAQQQPPRGRGDSAGPGRRRPVTPTFLLGPRRGHDEGHYQVQRSQEAGGRAPRAPAAAGRGLQTGPGGRESGGGSCCSSGPLPHPCRPGAAALEVWRGPSRRGGGAGAVVRARAAAPGTKAAPGPGLGLRAWVWVRVCVWARVSVTAAASASPAGSRSGEAASQPRRAAIMETGRDHGLRALASEGRGAALGTAHAAPSPGVRRPAVRPGRRGPDCSADSRRPTAPPARRSGDSTTPTRHAARR